MVETTEIVVEETVAENTEVVTMETEFEDRFGQDTIATFVPCIEFDVDAFRNMPFAAWVDDVSEAVKAAKELKQQISTVEEAITYLDGQFPELMMSAHCIGVGNEKGFLS